jgi:hypothetical protein
MNKQEEDFLEEEEEEDEENLNSRKSGGRLAKQRGSATKEKPKRMKYQSI